MTTAVKNQIKVSDGPDNLYRVRLGGDSYLLDFDGLGEGIGFSSQRVQNKVDKAILLHAAARIGLKKIGDRSWEFFDSAKKRCVFGESNLITLSPLTLLGCGTNCLYLGMESLEKFSDGLDSSIAGNGKFKSHDYMDKPYLILPARGGVKVVFGKKVESNNVMALDCKGADVARRLLNSALLNNMNVPKKLEDIWALD